VNSLLKWKGLCMKTPRCCRIAGLFLIWPFAILTGGTNVAAQTTDSNLVPVVTVQATQPIATATNPGVFTVFRAGNTNAPLNVWYDLGGTASNGVDYALIPPHLVAIAAGVTSNTIVIKPPTNSPSSSVAKTVVLQLTNSPLMTPVNYQIGSPSGSTVYIKGSGTTNLPPSVDLFEPKDGSVFYTPTNVQMLAKAADPDGSVTNVEFFAGTNDLGKGFMAVLDPPGVNGITGPVWFFNWQDPAPGNYPLTAVATDNGGAATTSAPVNITVLQSSPTNIPPVVRIIGPANGAIFFAPVDIPVSAVASDPDGVVTPVEFFAGTKDLGPGTLDTCVTPASGCVGCPTPTPICIYSLVWSNAPVGVWALTAVATDNGGAISTSAPVKISVLPSLPPPTNRPPIVSILATDPIAIEGTNCWVWPGETNSPPTWAAWPMAVCRYFTNCGPKTATFTVRRFGDTNWNLIVPYDIGGSASNGVDYVILPGFVTIPAGQCRASITIVPIDDGPPDVNKTVILTLLPDMQMNPLPGYVLGFPRRAAAIILDQGPCPTTGILPGSCFHLCTSGPDAAWFSIECSTDLVNWTPVCTNQVVNGSIDFVDPDAASHPSRFYRAAPLNDPPAE
jgi:hypothetical protein